MFLTVDLDEDDHRRVLDYLHLKNETFPMVMIVNMRADIERFRPIPGVHDNLITADFGLEADKVTKFGVDFLKGDVPRFYHSQKTPEDWNKHPVKVGYFTCKFIVAYKYRFRHISIYSFPYFSI